MFFETHAHYDDEAFDEDRNELLSHMKDANVGSIVNIACNRESCRQTLALMEQYPFMYGAIGFHPGEIADMTEEDIDWLRAHAHTEKIVAIGEIGLDYHWPEPAPDLQKHWFVRQLELAGEVGLPIVIHSRDAAKDTLDILHEQHAEEIGGVIHCYSYSREIAREYLDMGFYFGIGGVVTFANAKKLREALKDIPLERIVLETDSPYLAPGSHRGQRNCSLYLPEIAAELAAQKGVDVAEVEAITEKNARALYRI